MKKIMLIEIAVLVILLLVAILACAILTQGGQIPGSDPKNTTAAPVETSPQTTIQETTEPQPTWMTTPPGRQMLAQQYFVYDCQTDSLVTAYPSADQRVYPASVTKLLTAHIALQYLEPDDLITAGEVLDMVAYGSSVAELKKGDTLTAAQLVEAMLLPSGNDAAYVLAAVVGQTLDGTTQSESSIGQIDYIAGNTIDEARWFVQVFMDEMNRQAQELGLTQSHFSNPDGIHQDDHYMSFTDLCRLGELSLENETIMRYAKVSMETVTLNAGVTQWKNTNELIHPESKYYCPYAVGLKTGQTPTAGSCLLSAFEMEGKQWIIGVFGCPDVDDRFDDTLQLFNQTIGIE